MTDPPDPVAEAAAALAVRDFATATARLEAALASGDRPDARFLLAALAYGEDRFDDARAEWELAFRGFRDAGAPARAARTAMLLGQLHWDCLGNEATGRGWIERARRLLDEVGPCVEWGYFELARLACDRPDVDDVTRSATRALEIAREYGDPGLEVRALADLGLGLVSQGRVREGFDRLDEALACLTSGEVQDPFIVGTAFCSLLSSCDRAGDIERAEEWIRAVRHLVLDPAGGRPSILGTHCRLAFGGVLCAAGRWPEAEEALLSALAPDASPSLGHRTEALARLAELRLNQGRLDEAAELLAPIEDRVAAAGPLAMMHLQRGEPALAVATTRRALKRLVGDALRGAPLLAILVEAEIARGDLEAAAGVVDELQALSTSVDTPVVAGLVALSRGRVALARADASAALDAFDDALACLTSGERPALVAVTHLELAAAHAAMGEQESAVASARAAHAAAQRLHANGLVDRSAAVLRSLGATPPRSAVATATALTGLTAREQEVLDGLRHGHSNAQIAAQLYLSPKTVEHHVSRVLAKLGVRTRAEAAAVAAAAEAGAAG